MKPVFQGILTVAMAKLEEGLAQETVRVLGDNERDGQAEPRSTKTQDRAAYPLRGLGP
jgi:hypothetical protein